MTDYSSVTEAVSSEVSADGCAVSSASSVVVVLVRSAVVRDRPAATYGQSFPAVFSTVSWLWVLSVVRKSY